MNDDDLIYSYDMPALDADMLSDLGVDKAGLESIGGDILANMNLGSDIGGISDRYINELIAGDPAFFPMEGNRLSPADQYTQIMKDLGYIETGDPALIRDRIFPFNSSEASRIKRIEEDLQRDAEAGRFAAPGYGDVGQFFGGGQSSVVPDLMSNLSGDYFGSEDLAEADLMRKMDEYRALTGGGVQNLGAQGTLNDKGELVIGGYDRPGGYTSQWQTTPSGERVFLYDESGYYDGKPVDQTGIAVGKDGSTRALSTSQIQDMIKKGELNTYKSGYFGATGGSKIAPGGGLTTTKDGKTYTLKPDGKVYDTNTGKTITDTKTIRDVINQIRNTGGVGGVSTRPGSQNLLGSLLPLLLMMMAMRDKGGGGGTSSAVIPALSATQRQTPYTQIQQAPGYRPGQGGITYFNPVQYAPRMAAGGIADLARGRLLQGKGDGVSDSIPAMIGSDQPARLARGEYVVDARTVAELGNGSTDAGAERLDEMRKRVHSKRKKAKVGQDSKAYKALPA